MKIHISTSGRLHFGFMDLAGRLGRVYGSIGVAVCDPVTELTVSPSDTLLIESSDGKTLKRVRSVTDLFARHFGVTPRALIRVHRSIPEHKGLGSGTQLSLAVSFALGLMYGTVIDPHALALGTGRGKRSATGIKGFEQGGMVVDTGKKIAPCGTPERKPGSAMFRLDFPSEWRFVVVMPEETEGLSGEAEQKAMGAVAPADNIAEELCHVVLMKMLPSVVERDIEAFGSALTFMDRKTGAFFEPVQGGLYSEKSSCGLIDKLLDSGAYGAGQSSWGPAVYGVTTKEKSRGLANTMEEHLGRLGMGGRVIVTAARNEGAKIGIEDAMGRIETYSPLSTGLLDSSVFRGPLRSAC